MAKRITPAEVILNFFMREPLETVQQMVISVNIVLQTRNVPTLDAQPKPRRGRPRKVKVPPPLAAVSAEPAIPESPLFDENANEVRASCP